MTKTSVDLSIKHSNTLFSVGISLIEVMIITAIIALIGSIMVPRLYRSNEHIHLNTVSQEVADLFHLIQSQAQSTQEMLRISVNSTDEGIYEFSSSLPTHGDNTRDYTISLKPFILASPNSNIIDAITFYPDLSWSASYNDQVIEKNPLILTIFSDKSNKQLILYKHSHSIQLVE